MKSIFFLSLLLVLSAYSCNSTLHNLFGSKTPHEAYADELEQNPWKTTPAGQAWLRASETALHSPQSIPLPCRLQGAFYSDKPRALAVQFTARAGERLTFDMTKNAATPLAIFADVFKQGSNTDLLLSADTARSTFDFDVLETGTYVLRLQPKLDQSGSYALSISVGPSLSFPVSGNKAAAGSFWGDERDGGKRHHEGIDIFAPKLTPAIAAADGYITGVREGGLGGKTVWLQPEGKNIFLYYAHLDKQLVQEGQRVKKGDTVGLVGNTGNAKYTPSHLHFGVYTYQGAIDPMPFINRSIKSAAPLPVKNLPHTIKLVKTQKDERGKPVEAGTILVSLAVTPKGYIAEQPDGTLLQTPFTTVKALKDTSYASIRVMKKSVSS